MRGERMCALAVRRVGRSGIKARAPRDQFGHAQRTFGHERFSGGAVDKAVARLDRIFQMEGDVLVALGGDGDAALGIVGV